MQPTPAQRLAGWIARGRPPSVVEEIAIQKSPWSVDVVLRDALRDFTSASEKTREQWRRTAYVRKCELAGVIP